MSCRKLCSIAVLSVVLTLQLCDINATIKSNDAENPTTQPDSVTDDDLSTLFTTVDVDEPTTTELPSKTVSDVRIVDQKYFQNTSGEYKHEVLFSNGNFRAEQGEYEDHNGTIVLVIRGVFSYYTREGTYKTTLYIVDEFGYHNVEPPPTLTTDGAGLVDYRPDVQTASECNTETTYCIDTKLLALLVG